MNAQPKKSSLKFFDMKRGQPVSAPSRLEEKPRMATYEEIAAYRKYLVAAMAPVGSCTLKEALKIVFENTVDYFTAVGGIVLPPNGDLSEGAMKEQNLAILKDICTTVQIVDIYDYDYRQILYDYFAMLRSLLCVFAVGAQSPKAVKAEADTAWEDFCIRFAC
jgi:hypothetical protein